MKLRIGMNDCAEIEGVVQNCGELELDLIGLTHLALVTVVRE